MTAAFIPARKVAGKHHGAAFFTTYCVICSLLNKNLDIKICERYNCHNIMCIMLYFYIIKSISSNCLSYSKLLVIV